jgi:hypothetical protein
MSDPRYVEHPKFGAGDTVIVSEYRFGDDTFKNFKAVVKKMYDHSAMVDPIGILLAEKLTKFQLFGGNGNIIVSFKKMKLASKLDPKPRTVRKKKLGKLSPRKKEIVNYCRDNPNATPRQIAYDIGERLGYVYNVLNTQKIKVNRTSSAYDTNILPNMDRIRQLLLNGNSARQVSLAIGLSSSALSGYAQSHPDLQKLLDDTKEIRQKHEAARMVRRAELARVNQVTQVNQ